MASNSKQFSHFWIDLHSLLNVAWIVALVWHNPQWMPWWIMTAGLSFLLLAFTTMRNLGFKPLGLGYANLVTIGRLLFLLALGIFHQYLADWLLFAGFLLIVILDGFDGKLARKHNQTSEEGERLDAETDAQFVLILSWILYDTQVVGWWILIPGGLRYIYHLLFFYLPPNDSPPKKVRATIAVVFFLSLTLAFLLPGHLSRPLLIGSSILIFASFGLTLIRSCQLLLAHSKE